MEEAQVGAVWTHHYHHSDAGEDTIFHVRTLNDFRATMRQVEMPKLVHRVTTVRARQVLNKSVAQGV